MNDPRLNSAHLERPRRGRYGEAREELLDAIGSTTVVIERNVRVRRIVQNPAAIPARYVLRHTHTGRYYPLRVGINAIGRAPENDIILGHYTISRRHCVILVHATGGCEIHDTASRNGTLVNGRKVNRITLRPGDTLRLCNDRFEVLGDPADGPEFGAEEGNAGDLNPTGTDWNL